MSWPAHDRADPADPRLAPYRGVRDADLRGRDGLHCIETARVVRRFLAACARRLHAPEPPQLRVHSVLCDARTLPSLQPFLDRLPGTPVFVAPDADVVTAISGYGLHSGALALGVRPEEPGATMQAGALDLSPVHALASRPGVIAACDGVVHTDNVGAIFRNAASFGAAGVLLSPHSSDPLLRKTVRVSMGRVFDVPWVRAAAWPDALWELRQRHGWRIVAAEDAPGAVDVAALPRDGRTVVVFGAEAAGVSREVLHGADAIARIPMSTLGGALADDPPSLNVAVASAVMLDRLCAR